MDERAVPLTPEEDYLLDPYLNPAVRVPLPVLAQWLAAKLDVSVEEATRRLAEAREIAQRMREESDD